MKREKHHISILPFWILLIYFFSPPWICYPSQGRRSRAELEAIWNEKQVLLWFLFEHGDACATISWLIFWQVSYSVRYNHCQICRLFRRHCISVLNGNYTMCGILFMCACMWGTLDTAPVSVLWQLRCQPQTPSEGGLTCYWAPGQESPVGIYWPSVPCV